MPPVAGMEAAKSCRDAGLAPIGRSHGSSLLPVGEVVLSIFAVCTHFFPSRDQLLAIRQDDLLPFRLDRGRVTVEAELSLQIVSHAEPRPPLPPSVSHPEIEFERPALAPFQSRMGRKP